MHTAWLEKWNLALPLFEETLKARKTKLGPDDPDTQSSIDALASGYVEAGMRTKAEPLQRELIERARRKFGNDDAQTAGGLAVLGMNLLNQQKWREAEPILRECLKIREKKEPDTWRTFNSKSMLGGALLGQKKYAEAEPLLLDGYRGMKQREKTMPQAALARLSEAVDRLIALYTALEKPDDAKKWRDERARYPSETAPSRREVKK